MASDIDELLQDMELPTRRAASFLSEYLEPLDVERYSNLAEERRLVRTTR